MEFRDLKAQYQVLQPAIDAAVADVLSGGAYIGGTPVQALEEQLAHYVGTKHCITCANGTDALQLALMAWNIGEGDAVFVPDFTFFSSGEVVAAVGATPVFVDVDRCTYNLDPEKLQAAIQAIQDEGQLTPRVVVAVDLFGLPADYAHIQAICQTNNLLLLEDGAQGFGGSINGQMACSFGDISTTSFFPAKPLGCYGDGGAIFTNNDEWAALMRSYAVHGKGSMKYDNVRIGMNSRLDTLQAAILQVKLDAFIDYEVDAVNTIAHAYDETLRDAGLVEQGFVLPFVPEGYQSSWAQYTIQVPEQCDRNALQQALKDSGIPTMVYYPKPMHEQLAFAANGLCPCTCTTTETLCKTVLSLPMGPCLSEKDCHFICEQLKNLYAS